MSFITIEHNSAPIIAAKVLNNNVNKGLYMVAN